MNKQIEDEYEWEMMGYGVMEWKLAPYLLVSLNHQSGPVEND